MAHLVETSEDDSWMAVAAYIGDLIDHQEGEASKLMETAGSRFANECKQLYEGDRYSELLDLFASHLDVLFSKAENEEDLEGAINIICHLVPRIAGASPAAARLSSALAASPETRPERRLQALVNLYNVATDSPAKLAVLLQTLSFAKAAGLADIMLPVIRQHADGWSASLRLTLEDERTLYVAAADALRGCTRKPRTAAKEAYRLLCKCLSTYEGAAPPAAAAPVAAQVVAEFVRSPDMFNFDYAFNPAVAALASQPQHQALHQLLTIFLAGSVADFQKFAAANAAVLEGAGVSGEDALSKMRLLALMGLAHGASELSFQTISDQLCLPPGEVEATVVQAIGKRLVEARIDQLAGHVTVAKCAPRSFGPDQWTELRRQLQAWSASVAKVRQMGAGMSVLPRGMAELSVGA